MAMPAPPTAVTGPRKLSLGQVQQASADLAKLLTPRTRLLVGDATGLDALATQLASGPVDLHHKNPALPWRAQGAERSTRMVRAALAAGATLHAWPNKPCPPGLKPSKSWPRGAEGSGTWGTIALAVGLGLRVELHPLAEMGELPDWLSTTQQLALL
jgi:hypothetical protein